MKYCKYINQDYKQVEIPKSKWTDKIKELCDGLSSFTASE